ncbi:hypothetical protein QX776_00305 [Alteromonadaceae bacterium BrNp21-10]|nr:hypothetical protein [Alteromonadaceae bacterium BrNp21-10]
MNKDIMKNIVLQSLLWLSVLTTTHAWAGCDKTLQQLSADYHIITDKPQGKSITQSLQLVRDQNTVMHRYPATQITESWYLTQHELIKPTRYFDAYQRAIEYQPAEKVHGKFESDWGYRYQLVSDKLFSQLTLLNESGEGCMQLQEFSLTTANKNIELLWLPALKLVKSFKITTPQMSQHWTLQHIDYDVQKINALRTTLDTYQATDFADIGDDHSDPFLTKMVTLGFIEHGASGFYNSEGAALEGQHQH